jgi:hypothetical protein
MRQRVCCFCRPAGKLKLTVKATWLKDAKVDVDALTELSFGTHRSTEAGDWGAEEEGEQVGCVCWGSMGPVTCSTLGWRLETQSGANDPAQAPLTRQHSSMRKASILQARAGLQSELIWRWLRSHRVRDRVQQHSWLQPQRSVTARRDRLSHSHHTPCWGLWHHSCSGSRACRSNNVHNRYQMPPPHGHPCQWCMQRHTSRHEQLSAEPVALSAVPCGTRCAR